jgi:hypothetical protein
MKNLKVKDYKTLNYRGVDIKVSAELLQDIHAGTQNPSVLEEYVISEYDKLLPIIRNKKIDILLS